MAHFWQTHFKFGKSPILILRPEWQIDLSVICINMKHDLMLSEDVTKRRGSVVLTEVGTQHRSLGNITVLVLDF